MAPEEIVSHIPHIRKGNPTKAPITKPQSMATLVKRTNRVLRDPAFVSPVASAAATEPAGYLYDSQCSQSHLRPLYILSTYTKPKKESISCQRSKQTSRRTASTVRAS